MAVIKTNKNQLLCLDINNLINNDFSLNSALNEKDLENLNFILNNVLDEFKKDFQANNIPIMKLPHKVEELEKYNNLFERFKGKYENLVILGIGGSALGAKAVYHALSERTDNASLNLYVLDNIDPEEFLGKIKKLNLKKTIFNVISKSGATAETMAQFMIIYNLLKDNLGTEALKQQLIITTDSTTGVLRKIVEKEGFFSLDVPANIGGRFSVLTAVGLFPLTMCGIDTKALLLGAQKAQEDFFSENSKALWFAGLNWYLNSKKNKNILVFMPYANSLSKVAAWFNQLWNESLGKTKKLGNEVINIGQTAISALGVTDQHSQLQLYMEGPLDKVICFVRINNFKTDIEIPKVFNQYSDLNYLSGYKLSDLLNYEQSATEAALLMAGRANMTFEINELTAESLGYLLHTLQLAVIVSGKLYEINPLNQPGVELGKKFTFSLMGKKNFENYKVDYEKGNNKNKKYIL